MTSLFSNASKRRPVTLNDDVPQLLVIVDTEEEFDWGRPFDRGSRGVTSMSQQGLAQEIFSEFGITPTYVVDYCIVEDPQSATFIKDLVARGECELGAQLHTWVTPPYEEKVSTHNSYQCNLGRDLEAKKLKQLTNKIGDVMGHRPTIFKAGRYGLGPDTFALLLEEGYKVDCSVVPYTDFRRDGGPNFSKFTGGPFWVDDEETLLEIPLTRGFSGPLRRWAPQLCGLFNSPLALKMHVPGALVRSGLLERATLTPEGVTAREQIRLLNTLYDSGCRVFSLTYHSPSLGVGHTPYIRTESERDALLRSIRSLLSYFQDVLGGEFTSPSQLYAKLSAMSVQRSESWSQDEQLA